MILAEAEREQQQVDALDAQRPEKPDRDPPTNAGDSAPPRGGEAAERHAEFLASAPRRP